MEEWYVVLEWNYYYNIVSLTVWCWSNIDSINNGGNVIIVANYNIWKLLTFNAWLSDEGVEIDDSESMEVWGNNMARLTSL